MYFVLLRAVVKMVKNTHRHPFAGLAMWLSAIAMFVAGHKIEGNVVSMTPVLLFRLFSRKAAGYLAAKRVHLV